MLFALTDAIVLAISHVLQSVQLPVVVTDMILKFTGMDGVAQRIHTTGLYDRGDLLNVGDARGALIRGVYEVEIAAIITIRV